MRGDGRGYLAGLDSLHPGRGERGQLYSTICLSKVAKRLNQILGPDFDSLPQLERGWATRQHALGLQWGEGFTDRFTAEEAEVLWRRFRPVDEGLMDEEEQWSPGFQGESTRYYFNRIPEEVSVAGLLAGWDRSPTE